MKSLKSLLQRVAATIDRHRMFAPGQRLGVAVSGGADSVCLLHVLLELRTACLTVLHLDHGLRGEESRTDAAFVQDMAATLGLPVIAREAVIARSGNLEQNARRARQAFFHEAMASGAVERVAVGHTRSDQAETVLFRLLRGSGTAGLSGARPVTTEGLVRPLIEVDRAEVEAYLRARGVSWREDSTNTSQRFARNRIRHGLLPQLARDWNPEIVAALARTADQAAADEQYWTWELDRLSGEILSLESGAPALHAPKLAALPEAAARRLIRRAMEQAKGNLLGVDFHHIESALRLARAASGSGRVQTPGLDIRRSLDKIRFGSVPERRYQVPVAVPGVVQIPGTNRAICLELIENSETFGNYDYVYNGEMGFVDWGRVSGSLELRSWVPGDRIQPMGSSGIKKFKTLFQANRIPSWERVSWPLLVDGSAIVWSRRFGAAAEYAARPQSQTILRIRESELT
jgi:tRNA(Ile)-lysidine synthase